MAAFSRYGREWIDKEKLYLLSFYDKIGCMNR